MTFCLMCLSGIHHVHFVGLWCKHTFLMETRAVDLTYEQYSDYPDSRGPLAECQRLRSLSHEYVQQLKQQQQRSMPFWKKLCTHSRGSRGIRTSSTLYMRKRQACLDEVQPLWCWRSRFSHAHNIYRQHDASIKNNMLAFLSV